MTRKISIKQMIYNYLLKDKQERFLLDIYNELKSINIYDIDDRQRHKRYINKMLSELVKEGKVLENACIEQIPFWKGGKEKYILKKIRTYIINEKYIENATIKTTKNEKIYQNG